MRSLSKYWIYGNVYPSEMLIPQFHASKQEARESVVDYGISEEDFFRGTLKEKHSTMMLKMRCCGQSYGLD